MTKGAQIDTPHSRPPVALAKYLGFVEVLLCALLIDLRNRRPRVAHDQAGQHRSENP